MKKYFPSTSIDEYDWVSNTFLHIHRIFITHLKSIEQKQLLDFRSDHSLKLKFNWNFFFEI